jgi:hypothetical protein
MSFRLDDLDVLTGRMADAVRVAAGAVEEPGGDVEAVARTQWLGH